MPCAALGRVACAAQGPVFQLEARSLPLPHTHIGKLWAGNSSRTECPGYSLGCDRAVYYSWLRHEGDPAPLHGSDAITGGRHACLPKGAYLHIQGRQDRTAFHNDEAAGSQVWSDFSGKPRKLLRRTFCTAQP